MNDERLSPGPVLAKDALVIAIQAFEEADYGGIDGYIIGIMDDSEIQQSQNAWIVSFKVRDTSYIADIVFIVVKKDTGEILYVTRM